MGCTIAQSLFNVGPSSNNAWPPSKPTLNQRLMAWWEIYWIHTNSLAHWPLTTAIISSGPPAVYHGLLDKPICRPTSFMVSIADRIPPVVHQWLWAAKSHQLGGPPATRRRQSEGGFCHCLTTDDTILANNVASGPPAISRTSVWWATSGQRWRAMHWWPRSIILLSGIAVDGIAHHWQQWLQSVGHQWPVGQTTRGLMWAVSADRWLCDIWL